jgi:hypothetical protein
MLKLLDGRQDFETEQSDFWIGVYEKLQKCPLCLCSVRVSILMQNSWTYFRVVILRTYERFCARFCGNSLQIYWSGKCFEQNL